MIITKTPLRISFVGGGTDISDCYRVAGGAVVSATIDKYVYITVNKRFDDSLRVSYSKTEIVDSIDDLQHDIVRECMKMVGVTSGLEITSIADVPSGTGLGSSSSFTVGVLRALYTYAGIVLSARELAERACEIEIDILKKPIGKQDQYAAAYGGLNYFGFNPDESVEHEPIDLSAIDIRNMNAKLMMFFTGVTRKADSVLTEQKANTCGKMDDLRALRAQADRLRLDLESNGFRDSFADALREGWERKRTLASGVTNAAINELHEKAIHAGAKGGKLLGAGGGGFLLFFVEQDKQQAVRDALGLRELDFQITRYGSSVVYFA
jgi:D-glycero-alpha-D-manno-heptose-7-phosphate kinase